MACIVGFIAYSEDGLLAAGLDALGRVSAST